MKILSFLIAVVFCAGLAWANTPSEEETLSVCNKVMQNIFDDIVIEKSKHDELSGFDKKNLSVNEHQIFQIEYTRREESTVEDYKPYGFLVTVLPLDQSLPQEWEDGKFEFAFPLLNVKFAGYQRRAIAGRFDIQSAVQKHGQALLDYQQKFMPLMMSISFNQDVFEVDEDVVFTVTLTNVGSSSMKIKDFGPSTLYILYNGVKFIAGKSSTREESPYVLLAPGKSIKKTFHGDAFQFPQDIEIYASYNMTFEGVKPFSTRKIRIVEEISETSGI